MSFNELFRCCNGCRDHVIAAVTTTRDENRLSPNLDGFIEAAKLYQRELMLVAQNSGLDQAITNGCVLAYTVRLLYGNENLLYLVSIGLIPEELVNDHTRASEYIRSQCPYGESIPRNTDG